MQLREGGREGGRVARKNGVGGGKQPEICLSVIRESAQGKLQIYGFIAQHWAESHMNVQVQTHCLWVNIVSCPDVHAHQRRTSGGLSYISCHRDVSSVGVIEVLIALRMQL